MPMSDNLNAKRFGIMLPLVRLASRKIIEKSVDNSI
jgi:hypothetical protein